MENEFDSKKALVPIGTIAKLLGVNAKTLMIYDEEGILVPIRSSKNRRNYTLDDIEKAKLIYFLTRNLAINLQGVKIILKMLEKKKSNYIEQKKYIVKISSEAGFTDELQKENLKKMSSKGRKSKENSAKD